MVSISPKYCLIAIAFTLTILPCLGTKDFNYFINQEFLIPLAFFIISSLVLLTIQFVSKKRLFVNDFVLFLLAVFLIVVLNSWYYNSTEINYKHLLLFAVVILFYFTIINSGSFLEEAGLIKIINLGIFCNILSAFFLPKYRDIYFIGNFNNPNTLSLYLVFFFPYLVKTRSIPNVFFRVLCSVNLLFSVIIILSNNSRTSYLVIIVFFAVWLIKTYQFPTKKIILCFSSLFFAFVGIALIKVDSSKGRFLISKIAFPLTIEKPVSGFGINSFSKIYNVKQAEYFEQNFSREERLLADKIKYAYNDFLQLSIEIGILPVLFLVILLGSLFRRNKILQTQNKSFLPYIFLYYCIASLFYYPFYSIYLNTVWLLPLFVKGNNAFSNRKIAYKFKKPILLLILLSIAHGLTPVFIKIKSLAKWQQLINHPNTKDKLNGYYSVQSKLTDNKFFLQNAAVYYTTSGKFFKSNETLRLLFAITNNNELQNLLGDNYVAMDSLINALNAYKLSSNMVPNRFIPKYKLLILYHYMNDTLNANSIAKAILTQDVKIRSPTVDSVKNYARIFLSTKKIGK